MINFLRSTSASRFSSWASNQPWLAKGPGA